MAPHLIFFDTKREWNAMVFHNGGLLKTNSVSFLLNHIRNFSISSQTTVLYFCWTAFYFPLCHQKTKNARKPNDVRKSTIMSILLVVFAKKMQYTRSLGRFIFLLFSLCCFTAAELLATKSHALAINEFSKLFSIHNQTKNSNAHTYEYIDHGTCLSCFFYLVVRKKKKTRTHA